MVKWLRFVATNFARGRPDPYWQKHGKVKVEIKCWGVSVRRMPVCNPLRNMAAIFVNLAGIRDCMSGHIHFIPHEKSQEMQKHYLLYRAAYN